MAKNPSGYTAPAHVFSSSNAFVNTRTRTPRYRHAFNSSRKSTNRSSWSTYVGSHPEHPRRRGVEHPLQLDELGVKTSMVAFADATSRARTLALESGEKNASTIARPRQGVVNRGAYARVCAHTKS